MITISDAIKDFLLAREADGLAVATRAWYASILTRFQHTLNNPKIDTVTPRRVRQYIVDLRQSDYSEDSVYGHIRALHAFWRWCSLEYSFPNPMANVKYPKQPAPKLPRRAEAEDIAKVFASLGSDPQGTRDKALLAFLLDTGCRAAGVCRLKLADLDMPQRRAYVREKGNKWRAVFFGAETGRLLADWMLMHEGHTDAVFYNLRRHSPLTPSGLLQICYRLARNAGVSGDFHPHSLRHHFAVAMLTHGADSGILSQIMGHVDVDTTIRQYGLLGGAELADQHDQHREKVKRLIPRK